MNVLAYRWESALVEGGWGGVGVGANTIVDVTVHIYLDLRYLCGIPAIDSALCSWYGSNGGLLVGESIVGR